MLIAEDSGSVPDVANAGALRKWNDDCNWAQIQRGSHWHQGCWPARPHPNRAHSRAGSPKSHSCGFPLCIPLEEAQPYKPSYASGAWQPTVNLTMASFVDNIYIISRSARGAMQIADSFQKLLQQNWNQQIKPTGLECIAPKGVAAGAVNLSK